MSGKDVVEYPGRGCSWIRYNVSVDSDSPSNFRLGSHVLPAFYPSRNHIKMEITFLGMSWYTTVEITFKYKFHFPILKNLLHMSSSTNSSRLCSCFSFGKSNFSSCCHHTSFQQVGKSSEEGR